MNRSPLAPFLLLSACGSACPTPYDGSAPGTPAFTTFVEQQLDEIGAPGASIGLVRDHTLSWSAGFGEATPDSAAEADTLWMLASVSKLVTAAAVHAVAAEGRLDLEAPINEVLPFAVVHPRSDAPITAAMLLEHRSGLRDNDAVIWGHYAPGDPTESLEHWLRDVLVVGGDHYDADKNFSATAPDADRAYSNTGYALLGFIVEAVTGEPFDQWCTTHLFAPLDMRDTAWMLADLPEDRIARPYVGGLFGPVAHKHYGYPDYPDGQLRTTVQDFTRFLAMIAGDGRDESGGEVLPVAAAEALWGDGMGTDGRTYDGRTLRGHGGSDTGVHTEAWLDADTGRGFLLFHNRRVHTDRQREAQMCLENGLLQAAYRE